MITEDDLRQAIAECQGERNPNANTCIKLAAYYTILQHIEADAMPNQAYAYTPAPIIDTSEYIRYTRDTDFSKLIDGKDAYTVWEVMDELMQALKMILPQLYSGTVQKIRNKTQ